MRKSTIKKITLVIMAMCMLLSMVACGKEEKDDNKTNTENSSKNETDNSNVNEESDTNETEEQEPVKKDLTLSEWLAQDGVKIMYLDSKKPTKDGSPNWIYIIENGKISLYANTYPVATEWYLNGDALSYSDINKMTDEEIKTYIETYNMSQGELGTWVDKLNMSYSGSEYSVAVYSDSTGNNTEYECIYAKNPKTDLLYDCFLTRISYCTNDGAIVYDSKFDKLYAEDKGNDGILTEKLWIRYDEGLIKMDEVNSENVLTDPEEEYKENGRKVSQMRN